MIEFTSLDTFEIEGRGTVKVVENNMDRTGCFKDLYPEVIVDGEKYLLRGVEYQGHTQRKGVPIGLLIKKMDQEQQEKDDE